MYALNTTGKAVLITPQEIIRKIRPVANIDLNRFSGSIEVAEIRFVQGEEALGYDFYKALAIQKNKLVTSGNIDALQAIWSAAYPTGEYRLKIGDIVNAAEFLDNEALELWEQELWTYVAECVYFVALPQAYVELESVGIVKNNPITSVVDTSARTSVGIDLKDLKFLLDNAQQTRIEPLRSSVRQYLARNASKYPLWSRPEGAALMERNSAYIDISIYRDEDEGFGCGCSPYDFSRR